MEWISVNDLLPENSIEKDYLVTDGINVLMCYRNRDTWFIHGDFDLSEITHWMQLPKPPRNA